MICRDRYYGWTEGKVKPSAMAPSLKTHFLEAHRCSILHPKSPYFCGHLSFLSCTSEFLPFLALQVVVLLSFCGVHRASFLDWDSFHHQILPSFGTYEVTEFALLLLLPPVITTSVSIASSHFHLLLGWLRLVLHALILQWSLV